MFSSLKWLLGSLLGIFVVLSISYVASVQNVANITTSEIDGIADSVVFGIVRQGLDENGDWTNEDDAQYIDKDELIANLTTNVVSAQKKHGYDIAIDYLFFDGNENITEEEKEIRSLQFRIELLGEDGEVKGSAERRIGLNQGIDE